IGVDLFLRIAGDLERLVHDVGAMVADRAAAQLDPVADDVILPGKDLERVLRLQRLHLPLRHGEGVVAKIDLLLVLVIFEHREIDDPAEAESVLLEEVELLGDATARTTPPPSTMRANRPKPEPVKCSPTSLISSGLRRSGLSVPYLSSASLYGMRAYSPA